MLLSDKMAQNVTGNGHDTLASIFKQLLKAYEYLESTDLATSDPGYQVNTPDETQI